MSRRHKRASGRARRAASGVERAVRPIVALVGRPNVGKSTLFNRLTGTRQSLVEDTPGVTRDRKYGDVEWDGRAFTLVDTGGFEPEPEHDILREMRRQTQVAIDEAAVVVFVCDARAGMNPADREVAEHLRTAGKKTLLCVNKVDGDKQQADALEFFAVGLGEVLTVSAQHGLGVGDLLDAIVALLPASKKREGAKDADARADETASSERDRSPADVYRSTGRRLPLGAELDPGLDDALLGAEHDEDAAAASPAPEDEVAPSDAAPIDLRTAIPRIAVIGRPNAGKSTLINRLLGEERLLTFHEPGTTRDSVDALLERGDRKYLLIDTAGIRRQRSIHDPLERMCVARALDAIDRADVAWLLIDADAGITEQDAKVAAFANDKGRGLVLVLNKWDLVPAGSAAQRVRDELERKLQFVTHAPVVQTSARTGSRVERLLAVTDRVYVEHGTRISTGKLNRFFRDALLKHPPPTARGRTVKLYFISQVATRPPTFVVSVNYPEAVHFSYRRYVVNRLREAFGFEGVPLRVLYRQRGERSSD
jgi:GTP-binding protein